MKKTKIRALILDYGGVISKPKNPENVNNILQILKQDYNDFWKVYQGKRENYDNGKISGEEYWISILQHYGLEQNDSEITNLIQEDVKSWTQINDVMIQFIKESRGKLHKLAILSNMTRDTSAFIKRHFQWLELFDELIFSWEIEINKPDARIYEACLSKLQISPHECLFVDDGIENVNEAMKLGINAIYFRSFPEFRQELDKNFILTQ